MINLEEMETGNLVNSGVLLIQKKSGDEGCISCLELQHKLTEANERCARLELEIGKKNRAVDCLEGKLGLMEVKNGKVEDEVRALKQQRNDELWKSIRNGADENDHFTPRSSTPYKEDAAAGFNKGVAKCLDFSNEGNPHKINVSPSTPAVIPLNNNNNSDTDDDDDHSREKSHLAALASETSKKES